MNAADKKTGIRAPVLALDLGQKRIGVAISDELLISIRPLPALRRTSWKQLLRDLNQLILRLDAQTVVIGLPLRLNGSAGEAALEAERMAQKLAQSFKVQLYLQDERLTTREAEENLRARGHSRKRIPELVDSEAAAVILRDFLETNQKRTLVLPPQQTL